MMSLVSQYGIRLWKLRVTEAEIKASIRLVILFIHVCVTLDSSLSHAHHRLSPTGKVIPIRVFLTSDNGVSVKEHMYQEVEDPRTGEVNVA